MKLTIIIFGKIKSGEIESLVDYYSFLASRYFKLNFVVKRDKDGKIGESDLGRITRDGSRLIVLTERGQEFETLKFATKIKNAQLNSQDWIIVVGNAYGISDDLLEKADLKLSLGKMTFPHELSLVLLLEQLYRVGNLNAGGKYHK